MTKMMKLMSLAIAVSLVVTGAALAEVHTASLAPSSDALLPAGAGSSADVAFKFDVSSLPAGDKTVLNAYVEWTVPGVDEYGETNFTTHQITASWLDSAIEAGTSTISSATDEQSAWSIEEQDYARNGAYARLHLKQLVCDWLDGSATNHGVLVCMDDGDRTSLASGLADARLTIVYKFD